MDLPIEEDKFIKLVEAGHFIDSLEFKIEKEIK